MRTNSLENPHRLRLGLIPDQRPLLCGVCSPPMCRATKEPQKVQVAIARKMLVAVWYILRDGVPYKKPSDPTPVTLTIPGQ